jgi:L-lactate dehydrogenase complex protein LldF
MRPVHQVHASFGGVGADVSSALGPFKRALQSVTRDRAYRQWMQSALAEYEAVRAGTQARFGDWEAARRGAASIKWQAIEQLDVHLEQFASNLEARGTKVFWAKSGEEAGAYVLDVIRAHNARTIVKSKCMTSEEIHLNELLAREGYDVVESDLGEFIVQLREEPPYHFVFPAMHLKREEISSVFQDKLGSEPTGDPEALTMIARRVLRRKYIEADVGFTGANFGVAETGMISITENEGNARLTMSLPKVHIALMGIEKVLPRMEDLALFLPMLATAGTGQALTCYNSLIGGPRQPDEPDGPEEFHVVLLDNRRTRLLADSQQRDALRCIRCGACLNVCPIFKNIGGHSYGTTYQGPIGSVITPHLRGLQEWKHLSQASSLCGACTETCPVKIDLHKHLLRSRQDAASAYPGWRQKSLFRLFAFVMRRPALYRAADKIGRLLLRLSGPIEGTWLDPLGAWRRTRSLPQPAKRSFKDYWKTRR